MTDFLGDRECVTHHNACDCRERDFADLESRCREVAEELRKDATTWLAMEGGPPHRWGAAKRCRELADRLDPPTERRSDG